jgi:hypothetical protein
MDAIIIMVGRQGEPVYDVEVTPDVSAEEFADALSQAFGWQQAYDLQRNGENLSGRQTLAENGVWDGCLLTMIPSSRAFHPVRGMRKMRGLVVPTDQQPSVSPQEPVPLSAGFRPLNIPGGAKSSDDAVPAASENQTTVPANSPTSGARRSLNVPGESTEQSSQPSQDSAPITGWRKPSVPSNTEPEP